MRNCMKHGTPLSTRGLCVECEAARPPIDVNIAIAAIEGGDR